MSPIIIPSNFVNKPHNFYFDYINNNKNIFYVIRTNNIKLIINEIEQNNNQTDLFFIKQNFLYFLYKYSINDDISNPLNSNDGGKPENGFEFINNQTNNGYGIYHCHLSNIDSSILIWYPIVNKNNYFIHIEYLKHPTNYQYEQIIKDVYYKNDNGYNVNEYDYFINLKHLLPDYLYENKILKFNQFVKNLDI
jgi:hypothetical protein